MNHKQDSFVENRLASLEPSSNWKPDTAQALARLQRRQWEDIPTTSRWKRRSMWAVAFVLIGGLSLTFPPSRAFAQQAVEAGIDGAGDLVHGLCVHLMLLHNLLFHFFHG